MTANAPNATPLIRQLAFGPMETNAYIVALGNDKIVIDPGEDARALLDALEQVPGRLHAIVLTHAHFDHIGGILDVKGAYNVPVYVHRAEADWLEHPELNLSALIGLPLSAPAPDHLYEDGDLLTFGDMTLQVLHIPGHSPGGSALLLRGHDIVLCGDTLFYGSVGRTDLPGGSHELLIRGIRDKLLTLPEHTVLHPGHGPSTSVARERATNPFLRDDL